MAGPARGGTMSDTIEARPDMIGGVPTPPLAVLPKPERLFAQRADRFERLAEGSNLSPYLLFLAALCRVQARLCADLPAPEAPAENRIALARASCESSVENICSEPCSM